MTIREVIRQFPDEDTCKRFLAECRWPNGVRCPRCDGEKVYALHARPFHWICKNTGCKPANYRFSVTAGTIFENKKYPLRIWFQVAALILNAKKGISALQLKRDVFDDEYPTASYETVWYMAHRLRAAMDSQDFRALVGQVEVDETGIGGKDKNRHWNKKQHITGMSGKTTVIGAIGRKGNVVCQMIEQTDTPTLDHFVHKVVDKEKVELVATDEHPGYRLLAEGPDGLPHQVIRHSAGEYVRGEVHTNNIENFWSLLKRGIIGNFHHVSKKYLPLYLAEFSWRFNNRDNSEAFRALLSSV